MGIKQIPTKTFLKFLHEKGLVKCGSNATHTKFDFPEPRPKLLRPLIVRTKDKDIPLTHIHTNLNSLQCKKKEFEKWLNEMRGKGKKKKK